MISRWRHSHVINVILVAGQENVPRSKLDFVTRSILLSNYQHHRIFSNSNWHKSQTFRKQNWTLVGFILFPFDLPNNFWNQPVEKLWIYSPWASFCVLRVQLPVHFFQFDAWQWRQQMFPWQARCWLVMNMRWQLKNDQTVNSRCT